MGSKEPYVAYFIADGRVQCGAVIAENIPDKEAAEQGALPLYDFGHGFSTPQIFNSKEEAEAEL